MINGTSITRLVTVSSADTPMPDDPTKEARTFQGMNIDREIWRRVPGDYYSPSIHVTADGEIGINVGGLVYVRSVEEWHKVMRESLPPNPPVYMPWAESGGPNECEHGYAAGIPCPHCAPPAWQCDKCHRWNGIQTAACRSEFDTGIPCDGKRVDDERAAWMERYPNGLGNVHARDLLADRDEAHRHLNNLAKVIFDQVKEIARLNAENAEMLAELVRLRGGKPANQGND